MLYLPSNTIRIIKIVFNIILVAVAVFQLVKKHLDAFLNDWLFLITSDAAENLIIVLIAYGVFFLYQRKIKFSLQFGFALFLLFVAVSLSLLKTYRLFNVITIKNAFDYFVVFLGKLFLVYPLIYFVNRLDYFDKHKKLKIELEKAKNEALKKQLNPHFLFNAFNSLYSLSLQKNDKTSDAILKLSGMMRYMTDDSKLGRVKLDRELKFIEDYISIEKIRFGDNANIDYNVSGTTKNLTIEPLLLIVIVENAFKHGFYTNDFNSFIVINVKVSDKTLLIRIENSIQKKGHFNKDNREGKGLEILKKRLALSYPKSHKLISYAKPNSYFTQLEINL